MSIVHPLDVEKPAIYGCAQLGCRECLNGLMRWQSSGPLSYAELLQAGRIGLWQAGLHFDADRAVAFSTYAGVAIQRRIWRVVEQAQRLQGWLEPEELVDLLALAEERLWWTEVCATLAVAIGCLPGREREVMLVGCGWDGGPARDLTQVGRQWGVSRPSDRQRCPDSAGFEPGCARRQRSEPFAQLGGSAVACPGSPVRVQYARRLSASVIQNGRPYLD